MKSLVKLAVIPGLLAIGWFLGVAWAHSVEEVTLVDSSKAEFEEVVPGVSKTTLWGDPDEGPYGTFTKFKAGLKVPLHSHTNDMHIVVVEGTYIYKSEKGEEKRVGPGSYLFEPAGDRHMTLSDPKEGALFYEYSPGNFDLNEVKPK